MSKWQAWHREYDNPDSSLARRLKVVQDYVAQALAERPEPINLISLCAGDGRDSIPVIAGSGRRIDALLVESDPDLARDARDRAIDHEVAISVRTAGAGVPASFADHAPASVLLLCGIFGNIPDVDIERTIRALPSYLGQDALVIWTRGDHEVDDVTRAVSPSERARWMFANAGFEQMHFTAPADAAFRVGMHRWPHPTGTAWPDDRRLFTFLW